MFEDWFEELAALSVKGLSRPALCDVIAVAARLGSAADALEARAAAAVEQLGDDGAPVSTVLRSVGRRSQRDADRRARRAQTLLELPAAAEALAEGRITGEHVETLGRAVEATSPEAVAESDLVDKACRRPADLAARDARDWIRAEQTESEVAAVQQRRHQARRLSVWDSPDGMVVLHGEFDPVTGAELKSRLEAETNRLFHADGGRDGAGDTRTVEQRRADALCGLITGPTGPAGTTRAARPVHPVRYQIPVIATAQDGEITGGHLVDGTPVPLATLERLACGSDLFGMLFSQQGEPLWHGNRVRLATDAQWRALIGRDGGCAICSASPSRCEAHHIVAWLTGGPTDIDNLVLLCRHHHHLVHDNGHQIRATRHNADNNTGWELQPP